MTLFFPNLLFVVVSALVCFASSQELIITYNGFHSHNLILNGIAQVMPNGLLKLTNTTKQETGQAFYPDPINFKNSENGSAFSFSTTFVFAIFPEFSVLSGHGIAFVISPNRGGLPDALPNQYFGLFNVKNAGNDSDHVVAVELDTILNPDFNDTNDNHVGIDINGLISEKAEPAGYYHDSSKGSFRNLSLISRKPMQVWVEYDGVSMQMDVTLAPLGIPKPKQSLLSLKKDLSPVLKQSMYVGFSSATGSFLSSHYVLGWSFKMNATVAPEIDLSRLPELPRVGRTPKSKRLRIGLLVVLNVLLIAMFAMIHRVLMKRKFAEVLEDWELEYGPHRFKYKDLYIATKGFRDRELLGRGGFGRVYHGVLPSSKIEVAVKRMSHESEQGMKEFVAEIVSMGRLRHRNLVPLLGYCRRKGELLLVYEYMPYGSLDRFLFDQPERTLSWTQRFQIIRGVASALLYLHEEWEQLVIHRDVKASNVLLDGELNGRLGDFGLSRLYSHGTAPRTTNIVGTLGYLAPEHARTGKATTGTDVYAFGAFLLEVVCGRRPIEPQLNGEDEILVDWIVSCWKRGEILETIDQNMGFDYVKEEVELVMKLGLLCSHSDPTIRPSMRQVVLFLDGGLAAPELLSLLGISSMNRRRLSFASQGGFSDYSRSVSMVNDYSHAFSRSVASSVLSDGR